MEALFLFFVLREPGIAKIRHSGRVHGCVHGDASFHHDIVPDCK